uniref:Glycosyl transferase family 1 domain-containing protein n=1 Tax=Aureoumbra lagunensis TaxID=44058 RepID=A0A7S3JRY2_9STRA|mmetsp:Transcript_17000/g.25598  ORF Transcript_17000/g.25598 Transcript_17000/m.25598 type:complete len:600 (-) Transcript_17000:541-2340(-)
MVKEVQKRKINKEEEIHISSSDSSSGDEKELMLKNPLKWWSLQGKRNPTETKRITLPSTIKLIYVTLAFVPRLALYGLVFALGQCCRAVAKLFCSSVGAPHLANKRILYISDYMPPQVHGIALRVSQYTKYLRSNGHEVHVYTCCVESRARTSFDHPTLPFVANPFNSGNQISYTAGIKLAWALGAESWDIVHVFYPNALGLFVLPACRWRGIASYCSHHVAMDDYANRYLQIPGSPLLQRIMFLLYNFLYDACYRWPASYWGDVNASMTQTFVKRHLPLAAKYSHVATIGSGVDTQRFQRRIPTNPDLLWLWCDSQCASEREALCKRIGAPTNAIIWLMVQRLAPEKDIHIALDALASLAQQRKKMNKELDVWLVIAGDGPAREGLEKRAEQLFTNDKNAPGRVTFLGAVPNARLPSLYRAANVFLTCSRSETFGLTVTEALACGACVALPRCPVFDELYGHVLPESWRYDADDKCGGHLALIDAAQAAASIEASAWLEANPIDASWSAAAQDLDRQYDQAVKRGKTKYTSLRSYVQKRLIHLGRASLLLVAFYFVLSYYWRNIYCAAQCRIFLPSLPKPVRALCILTFIIALEWCHC